MNGDPLANTVVHYMVESGLLKRKTAVNGGTPTEFTVARNVYSMTVASDPDNKAVNIVLIPLVVAIAGFFVLAARRRRMTAAPGQK